jgi:sugar phosphate isomerase/epimerase
MDQVLIATERKDVSVYREWAEESGMGLELQAFANPKILDGNWQDVLDEHKRQLSGFNGLLGLHGAFYDMVSASIDPAIVAITRHRYQQNLIIARELEVDYIVFHVNYMGVLKLPDYRPGWHRRQVDFWGEFIEEAAAAGIYLVLENMWEDDPSIIVDILNEVNNPYLRSCLDLAHTLLFSPFSIPEWIESFGPTLYNCHLNNNDGALDLHWSLAQGVIDYPRVLPLLRQLPHPPLFTLEMPCRQRMEESLEFLKIHSFAV